MGLPQQLHLQQTPCRAARVAVSPARGYTHGNRQAFLGVLSGL